MWCFRTRLSVALLALSLSFVAPAAFGQPVTSSAPTSLVPDAAGMTGICAGFPSITDANQAGPATTQYLQPFAAGGTAYGRGEFVAASQFFWRAIVILASDRRSASQALVPMVGQRLLPSLSAQGDATRSQRCALLTCLVSRTSGERRVNFERVANELRCDEPIQAQVPPPHSDPERVEHFSIGGEDILAVEADDPLMTVLQGDENFLMVINSGPSRQWDVPIGYRRRVDEAILAYRSRPRQPPLVRTPHPATPSTTRSAAGYAVPIGLWTGATASLIYGTIQTIACLDARSELAARNQGQLEGWSREAQAVSANACTAAVVALPLAAALGTVGGIAWHVMRPVRIVPVAGPGHASLTLIASF